MSGVHIYRMTVNCLQCLGKIESALIHWQMEIDLRACLPDLRDNLQLLAFAYSSSAQCHAQQDHFAQAIRHALLAISVSEKSFLDLRFLFS
jgi:hypothetical protein